MHLMALDCPLSKLRCFGCYFLGGHRRRKECRFAAFPALPYSTRRRRSPKLALVVFVDILIVAFDAEHARLAVPGIGREIARRRGSRRSLRGCRRRRGCVKSLLSFPQSFILLSSFSVGVYWALR